MFLGTFFHRVDEKGRVALPAKFRAELAQGAVLGPGPDKCVNVYPLPYWEKTAAILTPGPFASSRDRERGRWIFSRVSLAELDSQGRIPLPLELRQKLEIKEDAAIVGMFNYLEIWARASWEIRSSRADQQAYDLFENPKDEITQKGSTNEG